MNLVSRIIHFLKVQLACFSALEIDISIVALSGATPVMGIIDQLRVQTKIRLHDDEVINVPAGDWIPLDLSWVKVPLTTEAVVWDITVTAVGVQPPGPHWHDGYVTVYFQTSKYPLTTPPSGVFAEVGNEQSFTRRIGFLSDFPSHPVRTFDVKPMVSDLNGEKLGYIRAIGIFSDMPHASMDVDVEIFIYKVTNEAIVPEIAEYDPPI